MLLKSIYMFWWLYNILSYEYKIVYLIIPYEVLGFFWKNIIQNATINCMNKSFMDLNL